MLGVLNNHRRRRYVDVARRRYAGDPGIALGVLGAALVFALGLGLGLAPGAGATPFRDWAAMKHQDDTVPKLERASAEALREYEALKVIQEYANSLRELIKAILRRRMN